MHPALLLLLRMKFFGALRKQGRRLRTPTGWFFAILGLSLFGLWLLAFTGMLPGGGRLSASARMRLGHEHLRLLVQNAALLLTVLTLIGSFSHRGLYLPKQEIEMCLAAPLSRRDVVRYRLLVGAGRTLFGALVLALFSVRHMPRPELAAAGVFVSAQTLPLIGQGLSLLLGDAENRLGARLARLPVRGLQVVGTALLILFFVGITMAPQLRGISARLGLTAPGASLLDAPWIGWISWPFQPWARAITARTAAEFAPWFALCAAVWLAAFVGVSRLDIDFRELSLATSADVARRLHRRRRGGGAASGSEASRRTVGWHVPWFFGRSPAGAIAWRKSCSILRKARGTVLTSLLIVGGLTVASFSIERGLHRDSALPGSLLIAGVGTLYLCAGLRFDFREDLDAMGTIKAWPVPAWKVFAATILPEAALVTALLGGAITLRAALFGRLDGSVLLVAAAIPVVVFLWTAIDNAVFLYLPQRFTPGQDGTLHHTGRAMALTLLRMLAFALAGLGALLALLVNGLLTEGLDWTPSAARSLSLVLFALVLTLEFFGAIAIGGWLFRRFDVARDRG